MAYDYDLKLTFHIKANNTISHVYLAHKTIMTRLKRTTTHPTQTQPSITKSEHQTAMQYYFYIIILMDDKFKRKTSI
jgi:hypothetical protein